MKQVIKTFDEFQDAVIEMYPSFEFVNRGIQGVDILSHKLKKDTKVYWISYDMFKQCENWTPLLDLLREKIRGGHIV